MANTVTTIETRMFIGETTLWLNNQTISKEEYQARKDAWLANTDEYKESNPFTHATAQVAVHFADNLQRVTAWNDDCSAKSVQETKVLQIPQAALKAMLLQNFEKAAAYQRECRKKNANEDMRWDILCDTFDMVKVKVTQELVPVGATHQGGTTPYSKESYHTTIEVVEE